MLNGILHRTTPPSGAIRRTLRKLGMAALAMALAAVTFWVLPASPAYAGDHKLYTDGAEVTFLADGDYVSLCDTKADGRHAELNVKNVTKDPDVMEYHIEASGYFNCKTVHAGMEQPWNLAEKHCFRFTVWVADGNNKIESSVRWDQFRNYNNDYGLCYGVD